MPDENGTDSTKEIRKTLGSCNCILIVPDGYPYDGKVNPLTILAESAIGVLHSYGVINTRYKRSIVNLADIGRIVQNKRITNDFLVPIRKFKEEIKGNNQTPLVIILQSRPDLDFQTANLLDKDILIGIGQGERNNPDHPHRPTFAPSIITKLRLSLADNHLTSELAPPASDLCGHDFDSLNQLFSRKDFPDDLHDAHVSSILLTFNASSLAEDADALLRLGLSLGEAILSFTQKMPFVRKVQITSIDTKTAKDKNYIFRIHNDDDASNSMLREAYIDELAQSIKKSGLLHPLVLLQKKDGNYKILCGFRRFQALSRLHAEWVEAKIYQEGDFSQEDFFDISLAENTKRRNLNPIEIGNFLESAARDLDMNNTNLAEKFGQTLGIGRPNQNVAQSTVHKYRKIYDICVKGESKEIINDIINENLQFTIAAEILAPIKNPEDRNSFYTQIIKPLNPTRPQIIEIKRILETNANSLKTTLEKDVIRSAIERAQLTDQKGGSFLKFLQKQRPRLVAKNQSEFQNRVMEIRKTVFGGDSPKNDFKISRQGKEKKNEITIQLKIRPDNLVETLAKLKRLPDLQESLSHLFSIGKS
jgi:ParB/RepB/Spo0J family partition protein